MSKKTLPKKNSFNREFVSKYQLTKEIGRGNIGVVYHGLREDIEDEVAIKIIPQENLRTGWKKELIKTSKLTGIPQVVQYKNYTTSELNGKPYICIIWEYIDEGGCDLRTYIKKNRTSISISFIENILREMLIAFIAMKEVNVVHNDLHEGNIMIAYDKRTQYPDIPTIKITDFGIAGSKNILLPKDDYLQLAKVCNNLLKIIDPAQLSNSDYLIYSHLIKVFIPKYILEKDPTMGSYVRNPRALLDMCQNFHKEITKTSIPPTKKLKNPFDYLRCEMMGESTLLLQTLYSKNFPGYQDLLRKNNTILTGPRGCGKTMIFRNLSLKTQILSKRKIEEIVKQDFIAFYYHCNDLYFAFPYPPKKISDQYRQVVIHYFNLSILHECVETLIACKKTKEFSCDENSIQLFQKFIRMNFNTYDNPPLGTDILRYILTFIIGEKRKIREFIGDYSKSNLPTNLLKFDFIKELSHQIRNIFTWGLNKTIFYLLDDYSLPTIGEEIQKSIHDFIFFPTTETFHFYKISTESIVTFHQYNSRKKMMEEGREYVVVDLGDYFLNAEHKIISTFLAEVINNRLKNTEGISNDNQNIIELLGHREYKSYNEMARAIRLGRGKEGKHIYYSGWEVVVDLCSGDVAYMLDLIKSIIGSIGGPEVLKTTIKKPLDKKIQNKFIRELGNNFLNRIEAIPDVGKKIRQIVEVFGEVAHWYVKNRNSKNQDANPPWQAFRIEVRDVPDLNEEEQANYDAIVRYGIFIRDIKGKSQRGAIVPRLYLRKLLIPTFLLTFSKRDNIGMNPGDFKIFLKDPKKYMKQLSKIHENQERLNI